MSRELIISKIREGIVIDHVLAGRAMIILKILNISGLEGRVALVMNVESSKMGRKDIIKIEGRDLTHDELNLIALISPTATVNRIRNYEVAEKFRVQLPTKVRGIVKCKNPKCITNKPREPITSSFTVIKGDQAVLKCDYCGAYNSLEDVERQLVSRGE
ncbi:aspartate carbamoyltransferase regulatory subunit [Thermocladium modestius]|uniref:Aspartate carbamoyltransferase regulatory chain n=1 Tax=Thermocladium modestius TaxID=62609 RepID=A0A830GVU9_9CREN|nr:aspartate carbamoyltransferase regulatory subunit [Thermocladium modestius]GGP21296.1 aspartate carbamoyltransferase regulatory subunit [Thermocladium modestius]